MLNQYLPNKATIINTADFLAASTLVIGATYSLCASTYLTPFIISNIAHLGGSYLLPIAPSKNIITKEMAQIIESALIATTICMSYSAFEHGASNTLESSKSYAFNALGTLQQALPDNAFYSFSSLANAAQSILHHETLVNTFTISSIPKLCFGIIGKLSDVINKRNNKESEADSPKETFSYGNSIIADTIREFVGCFAKYSLHLNVCKGAFYAVPFAGALQYLNTYYFSKDKPAGVYNKCALGAATALEGAINYSAYQGIAGNDYTSALASMAIETGCTIINISAKYIIGKESYAEKVISEKSSQQGKAKTE